MATRTVMVHQTVPEISLWKPGHGAVRQWIPNLDTEMRFEFREAGVEGVVSLDLDFEHVVAHGDVDHDGTVCPLPLACSGLGVIVEGECDEGVSENEFLSVAQKLTHVYVNRMLSYIRLELNQHWVTSVPISEWDLEVFLRRGKAKWLTGRWERPVLAPDAEFYDIAPAVTFDGQDMPLDLEEREALFDYVEQGMDVPTERELVASAKQYFVTYEYRMAAVEGVTAVEVGIGRFVSDRFRQRKALRRFKDVRDRLGVMAYLKSLLPLAASDEELEACRGLIDDCVELVKVRNRVVHRAKSPTAGEVEKIRRGIVAAGHLLDVMSGVRP